MQDELEGQTDAELMTAADVQKCIRISRTHLARITDPKDRFFDPTFPIPISLSPRKKGAIRLWLKPEIRAWLQAKFDAR
jgi:predicted DNA-binding transcriptional regulator AlpA